MHGLGQLASKFLDKLCGGSPRPLAQLNVVDAIDQRPIGSFDEMAPGERLPAGPSAEQAPSGENVLPFRKAGEGGQ